MSRLRSRLQALEATRAKHVDDVRRAPEQLAKMLTAKAERIGPALRDRADWCATAPPIDVLAVALDEVGGETRSEAAWGRVRMLASQEGLVGRVFTDLAVYAERRKMDH